MSYYAFIRFATLEDAERVARLTNGMHVYGWPIISKIASSDWSNQNKVQVGTQRNKVAEVRPASRDRKVIPGTSYTEMIASDMFYIGDKNVLWTFQSIRERDTFIRSIVIWEDLFSSVGTWTIAITPQSRLSWVEFRGIPLHYWCEEFFMRLGWAVGEPLLIDEDTRKKDNLLRGRVLVLIPFSSKCPSRIKIVTGKRTYSVSAWEDAAPKFRDEETDRGMGKAGEQGVGSLIRAGNEIKKGESKGKKVMHKVNRSNTILTPNKKATVVLEKKRTVCWSSTSEESEERHLLNYPKFRGENSNTGVDQMKGGNIVIKLGCAPDQVEGLSLVCGIDKGGPVKEDSKGFRGPQSEIFSKAYSKAPDEILSSSSGKSLSHVSETQNQVLAREVNSLSEMLLPEKERSKNKGDKTGCIIKSHGMKTKKDKVKGLYESGEVECGIKIPGPSSDRWNLEVEVAKSERNEGLGNKTSMRNFKAFMDYAKVVDLPMHGMSYTWTNNRDNASWARLDSLPTYFMSMFIIPVGVSKKIEKLQRDFFCNDGILKKKVHVVNWISVCKSKKEGGLRIGRIKDKGESLFAKWIWRFGREHSSLWKSIICAKYGRDQNSLIWNFSDLKGSSHFVKNVNSLFKEGTKFHLVINKGFQVVVGKGESVRLWEDLRWDAIPLRLAFPKFFALASNKVGMLKEYESWVHSSWVWKVGLRRQLFGWERDQWDCFLMSLQGVSVRKDISDALA
ncbi:hypothetical protein Dsin_012892 [Dipteronia sinensis]|uniref:DUF4283 domain-containing protein n=1 Tax=Dipteronia sinensis TaxID=43782 RepID=A0AAE0AK88_9ROSI|nr:hypothetical protein Dsin_012892 [Dipteronia sinensis]